FGGHDVGLDARDRDPARAGLDRQHADAVGVGDDRPAGLGLPHVIEHWYAIPEDFFLQPLPRRRVQHLTSAEDAVYRGEVVWAGGFCAVAHELSNSRRRCEDAANVVLGDDSIEGLGGWMVDRTLVGNRGAADEQRGVD